MNRCYTESDVIAELRGWNAMSGDNDVVCVLWICVVVGTESYVCDQLPKLPEEPPPIGDCAGTPQKSGDSTHHVRNTWHHVTYNIHSMFIWLKERP